MDDRTKYEDRAALTKLPLFYLVLILFIALFLRFFLFRTGETISSSDEILLYEYSLKPVYAFYSGNFEIATTELFRFFNFAWGWGTIMFSTMCVFFLSFFGIPLTEVTINVPYIMVGLATIIVAYHVAKEIINPWYALVVSLLIAIMPSHVAYSRTIGVNGIVGLFFFLTTFYLFIKYCKTEKENFLLGTYLMFGFYFISDNQGLGIIPLLLYTSYIYCEEKTMVKRTFCTIKKCVSWKGISILVVFLLPTIVGAGYLWIQGLAKSSYLNLFHSKPFIPSFYVEDTIASIIANTGVIFTLFLISGFIIYLLLLTMKKVSKESTIFFIWFFIYSVPWLFLVPPEYVDLRVYNNYTIVSLIFLTVYSCNFLGRQIKKRKACLEKRVAGGFLFLTILLVVINSMLVIQESVYGYDVTIINQPKQVFGAVGGNTGIKAVGYFVREHVDEDAAIFVDVESFVGSYYLSRPIIGNLDLDSNGVKMLLEKTPEDKISYIFLSRENADVLKEIVAQKGFVPFVYAVEEDAVKGILYQKRGQEQNIPIIISIKEYDLLFDKKYGHMESLFIDFG